MKVGVRYSRSGKSEFVVWAPSRSSVDLEFMVPRNEVIAMTRRERGYWYAAVDHVPSTAAYRYRLDGTVARPDPCSQLQSEGVHGLSRIVDHRSFRWEDQRWKGIPLADMVFYELHVGTFTPEGAFEAVVPRLGELKDLGVNVVELMPVAQFPGDRNWGYDGAYPFAVQHSYGGPSGLKKLVNECHKRGLAVALDVVYNHLGPEGNYLADFGPYFTDRYKTPWGSAVNFDGPWSDEVRNYFIQNALYWLEQFHIDALRLDAVHAIYDMSARPFLQELAEEVGRFSLESGRTRYVIAESNLNDVRVIRPRTMGGFAHDAQWCDDFHHCVHTLLTGEQASYYEDFGTLDQLVKCLREGFVYSGQYSRFRGRRHGNPSVDRPPSQFVVCSQNHDQIGNRMMGERLSSLVSFEALKLAGALTIFSPFLPLLFMGEEYAEKAPFLYFVSHSDEALIGAVRKGRTEEFKQFRWTGDPPDPQASETFMKSKIRWELREQGPHSVMLNFYKHLLSLRKEIPALAHLSSKRIEVFAVRDSKVLVIKRWFRKSVAALLVNLGINEARLRNPLLAGKWRKLLDSSDGWWIGPGVSLPDKIGTKDLLTLRGQSAALFLKGREIG